MAKQNCWHQPHGRFPVKRIEWTHTALPCNTLKLVHWWSRVLRPSYEAIPARPAPNVRCCLIFFCAALLSPCISSQHANQFKLSCLLEPCSNHEPESPKINMALSRRVGFNPTYPYWHILTGISPRLRAEGLYAKAN